MLQRVQTLFLLFILLVGTSLFFLPFQDIVGSDGHHLLCLMPGCNKEIANSLIYLPLAVNAVVILLAAFAIFQYKHRIRQAKLSNMLAILNILIVGLFFLLSFVKPDYNAMLEDIQYRIGSFLPVLSAIAAFLAAYYIKKDEKLVRSADRIR